MKAFLLSSQSWLEAKRREFLLWRLLPSQRSLTKYASALIFLSRAMYLCLVERRILASSWPHSMENLSSRTRDQTPPLNRKCGVLSIGPQRKCPELGFKARVSTLKCIEWEKKKGVYQTLREGSAGWTGKHAGLGVNRQGVVSWLSSWLQQATQPSQPPLYPSLFV